jgi:cation:H+ antiporter
MSLIVPAVGLIVLGATGMVHSALVLADHWQISKAIVGVLILGVLTALPNAFTGIRLGLDGRSAALVSETLGSNTINLLGGILLPALAIGLASSSAVVAFDLVWLLAMTAVMLALLAQRRGLGRHGGSLLICLYAVFVVVQLVYA